MPGATRAGPASPTRPELPEALLQRMQAVVKAAHAQALQEEEAQRGRGAQPDQDAPPEAPASLPRRVPGTAGAPKEPNGVPWRKLPAASPGRFSDEDAEFDTDPFLPRLTASGTIASSPANSTSAQQNHTAQQNHSTRKHTKQQDDTVKPGHALKQDRALRRRDRRATKRERATQAERERAEQEQVAQAERAERAERERTEQERATRAERAEQERAERERAQAELAEQERAAQAERERAAQAERERAAQAERERAAQAERERAAQAERERAAQAERERAAQAERERAAQAERAAEAEQATQAERELAARAAWAEREHAAQAEHERAAQAERERPGQAAAAEGMAGAEQDVAERAEQAERTAAPDQSEPEPKASPTSTAEPGSIRTPAKQSGPPSLSVRKAPRHRRYRTAALAIGVAAALAVGPLALMLSRSSPPKLSAAEATSDQAATWVAQQVSSGAVVSCDLSMCQTLRADGVPVGDLLVIGPKARDLLNSQVIVSTATIRQLFGSRLAGYAPTVLARFGSGKTRIDVRVIAHEGAASYLAALRADLQERKNGGQALAVNSRIELTATARRQMDTGQVDAQLLLAITSLAIVRPLDILAFGDLAPGASAGVPLRSVTLAVNGNAAVVRSMLETLRSQHGEFRAAHIETTQRNGQRLLVIEFAAPMPLGLINGPNG